MKKEKVIEGFFVGDTVILNEETEITKKQGLKIGTIGRVSKEDNYDTLKGWKVIDYEKKIKDAVDKMDSKQVDSLFKSIVEIFGEDKVKKKVSKKNL